MEEMEESDKNINRLTLTDDEWAKFADAVVLMLRRCHELDIRLVQLMILYTVQGADKRRAPFDKLSIAAHIGQPRQTVYRHIDDLVQRGWLRTKRRGHQDFVFFTDAGPDFERCVCALGIMKCAHVLIETGNADVYKQLGIKNAT